MTYLMRKPTLSFAMYLLPSIFPPFFHVHISRFMILDSIFLGVPQLEGALVFASIRKTGFFRCVWHLRRCLVDFLLDSTNNRVIAMVH